MKGALTELGGRTLGESVFGNTGPGTPWMLVKLNFSAIFDRDCNKDAGSKDFTHWFLKDLNNPKDISNPNHNCILGGVQMYVKRNLTSQCRAEGLPVHPHLQIRCNCSDEDFELDFGFEKSSTGITKSSWYFDGFVAYECVNGTYSKSKGYVSYCFYFLM